MGMYLNEQVKEAMAISENGCGGWESLQVAFFHCNIK